MFLDKERSGLEKKFFEMSSEIIQNCGYELYDLDYLQGSQTLRVFIRNPETDTADLEDCVKIDRALTPFIQEESWVPESLVLEVSSPGIYRNLKTRKHFEESLDEVISLTVVGDLKAEKNKEINPKVLKQKKFRGLLKSVGSEEINLETENKILAIDFDQIKKANIDPDFEDLT